jgi:hypothetical protein
MIFMGLGDQIDASDTCTINPSDPICVEYYGSQQAANKASVQSTAPSDSSTPPSFDFTVAEAGTCPSCTSWDDGSQSCKVNWWDPFCWGTSAPKTAAAPVLNPASTGGASAAAASLPSMGWKWLLGLTLVAAAGAGGYYVYTKRKR